VALTEGVAFAVEAGAATGAQAITAEAEAERPTRAKRSAPPLTPSPLRARSAAPPPQVCFSSEKKFLHSWAHGQRAKREGVRPRRPAQRAAKLLPPGVPSGLRSRGQLL